MKIVPQTYLNASSQLVEKFCEGLGAIGRDKFLRVGTEVTKVNSCPSALSAL